MPITILNTTTKNPITLMGERAGICQGGDITDPEKNYKRGLECLDAGHGRVQEYVNVEMVIEGYSARVIREWYTHIGGAPTRLQESTRYLDMTNFEYVTPKGLESCGKDAVDIYETAMRCIRNSVAALEGMGVPREDAALLLPLGMTTKIVDKRNLRSLIEMSHQRLCKRAYHEYRKLMATLMGELCCYSDEWAYLVEHYFKPKCEYLSGCPEKRSCGYYAVMHGDYGI